MDRQTCTHVQNARKIVIVQLSEVIYDSAVNKQRDRWAEFDSWDFSSSLLWNSSVSRQINHHACGMQTLVAEIDGKAGDELGAGSNPGSVNSTIVTSD